MVHFTIFPEDFREVLEQTEIAVPPDLDHFLAIEYPHAMAFLRSHLMMPLDPDELINNANIIAKIPKSEVIDMSPLELFAHGLKFLGDKKSTNFFTE